MNDFYIHFRVLTAKVLAQTLHNNKIIFRYIYTDTHSVENKMILTEIQRNITIASEVAAVLHILLHTQAQKLFIYADQYYCLVAKIFFGSSVRSKCRWIRFGKFWVLLFFLSIHVRCLL